MYPWSTMNNEPLLYENSCSAMYSLIGPNASSKLLLKDIIHGFREKKLAKNKMLPLKFTHCIVDFSGIIP